MCHKCAKFYIFGYLEALGDLNNQSGPILIHIDSVIYINLPVKYGSNLRITVLVKIQDITKLGFFGGPYIHSKCTKIPQWQ